MPSSAADVTNEVDVGERLRVIRSRRRQTLREVAERAGLSETFLSQVERGRASASVASLRRIADALGIAISDLFQPVESARPRVLRRDDRPSLAFGILGRKLLLTPRPLHHLEVFVGELDPGGLDRRGTVRARRLRRALRRHSRHRPTRARRRALRARGRRQHRLPQHRPTPHLESRRRRRRSDVDHQSSELLGRNDGHGERARPDRTAAEPPGL